MQKIISLFSIQVKDNRLQGAVYIQIIKCRKSVCAITEAHDALMIFWILKNISSGILISLTGIQLKCLCFFLHEFSLLPFFIEIFPTQFTWKCFKCLLNMNKHIYKIILVICVEKSSRWNSGWKNIRKKITHFFFGSQSKI